MEEYFEKVIEAAPAPVHNKELSLRDNHPDVKRLDITASLFQEWSDVQTEDFLDALPFNYTVTTVHLSGQNLDTVLSDTQILSLLEAIGRMHGVTEYFVFHGGVLSQSDLAQHLPTHLDTILLWNFPLGSPAGVSTTHHDLAAALRQHSSIRRITLNLPSSMMPSMTWGCLDVYAMALCQMPKLDVVQIRCTGPPLSSQQEPLLSPEAVGLLIQSTSIHTLYLENCGLLDDHMDVLLDEWLPNHNYNTNTNHTNHNHTNTTLQYLHLKDNLFTDDTLHTVGRLLSSNPPTLLSMDLSGVLITPAGGQALADGMASNTTLQHLELEGQLFHDEFVQPVGHLHTDWWKSIQHYQLRLNRARAGWSKPTPNTTTPTTPTTPTTTPTTPTIVSPTARDLVDALCEVSDTVPCLYALLRAHPQHSDRLASLDARVGALVGASEA